MTKDEVTKLWMDSPESLQFLNNATKFGSITNFVGFPIPLVALSAHIE